ncbi:MAG: peptidase S41 [Thermobacillus sp. ZCTH02-B1]|uniref:S41 family peptidase n=1 Tax=Thermobacillus sp. ZCTH02-B1 TaxID=1858795 RepID=UPI000B56D5E1|nr:S41 family peptidase [Thermobacillus sp. ZCTH02-B1]OUM94995.1 MAG: peptidase S41 [Thermobacillus sp. ZCTH02-B1]
MLFRGRTVTAMLLLTALASALVTLTAAERWLLEGRDLEPQAGAAPSGDGGLTEREAARLGEVLDLIERKYYVPVDREKLLEGAIRGMLETLDDPYSAWLDKSEAEQLEDSLEGTFSGIGARLQVRGGLVIVESAIKDSPAERAGLHPRDVILSVNGHSLVGVDLNEAVNLIRGPKGTKAKLLVQREGVAEPFELILVRDEIDLETIFTRLTPDGIGVIEIRQFTLHSLDKFGKALEELEASGMKALVIDVRNNPGGPLPAVVSIAQLFIPKGEPIVQVENRQGGREVTVSQGEKKPYPVAVLINRGSASAAEVLAAALQESAGALLVGETTFGKGTVQVSYESHASPGSQVKLTIAKWLTPSGRWVHDEGVSPDIAVEQPDYFRVARLSRERTLARDMAAEDVKSLQIMLKALGYHAGRTDGYFDAATEEALKAFQQAEDLPATGRTDDATADRLEQRVRERIGDPANDRQLNRAIDALRARVAASASDGGTAEAGSAARKEQAGKSEAEGK